MANGKLSEKQERVVRQMHARHGLLWNMALDMNHATLRVLRDRLHLIEVKYQGNWRKVRLTSLGRLVAIGLEAGPASEATAKSGA